MAAHRPFRTEYKDAYSEQHVTDGMATMRSDQAGIESYISTLPGKHSSLLHTGARLAHGHPRAYVPATHPGLTSGIGTSTQGAGMVRRLEDSVLYQPTATWAHWRVHAEGKFADSRRKYRGNAIEQ